MGARPRPLAVVRGNRVRTGSSLTAVAARAGGIRPAPNAVPRIKLAEQVGTQRQALDRLVQDLAIGQLSSAAQSEKLK